MEELLLHGLPNFIVFFLLSSMQSSTDHYSLFFTTGFHSAWSKFLWTPKRWVFWLLLAPLHTAYIVDLSLAALANMRANGMTDFCFKLSHHQWNESVYIYEVLSVQMLKFWRRIRWGGRCWRTGYQIFCSTKHNLNSDHVRDTKKFEQFFWGNKKFEQFSQRY